MLSVMERVKFLGYWKDTQLWQRIVLLLTALVIGYIPASVLADSIHHAANPVLIDKKGKDKKKDKQDKDEKGKKEKTVKKISPPKVVDKPQTNPGLKQEGATPAVGAVSIGSPASSSSTANSDSGIVAKPADAQPAPMPVQPPEKKSPEKNTGEKSAGEKAEDKKEENESESTFKFSSSLVAVPVSVIDSNGDPVRNLKAEEFILDEEGEKQQVQSLGEPGQTPLELTLLFDISGSVFERFEFQKQAAARFLDQVLKPNDVVSVFLVGFEGKLVIPRTRNFPKVKSEMMALEPTKEGTAFYASVVRAAKYLSDNAETGSRRVMVVISDGEDNFSKTVSLGDAARELQRSDMVFYSINPSGPSIKLNRISLRGQNSMNTLASDTGGVAFLPDKEDELPRVFRQIAAELNAQYLLGYYSSNEASDGKFRRIKVQLPRYQELRVRARQGYYAPKE